MKASQQNSAKTPTPVENKAAQSKDAEKPFENSPSNNYLKLNPPDGFPGEGPGGPPLAGPPGVNGAGEGSNQRALRTLNALPVQPKLKLNPVGDSFEREADRVAEAVTGGVEPDTVSPAVSSIQRKSSSSNGKAAVAPPGVQQVAASPGRPLSAEARSYFEPRFGRDFSGVRVHTGPDAEAASDSINAEAFTAGNSIAFAKGNYAPETGPGRKLLAHELTHVVQQEAGGVAAVQRQPVAGKEEDTAKDEEQVQDVPPPKSERPEVKELDYAFFFAGGDYGKAARAFIKTYYPEHVVVQGSSFEQMFDRMFQDLQKTEKGKDAHLRQLVIVTHANAAGGLKIPLTRGDVKKKRFFNIWDLADLQQEFRQGMHQRFRERRMKVVAELIDSDTSVIVRGCEFGQSEEALDALRAFFGGQPRAWAPMGFQGYETLEIGKSMLKTPEQAFDFLMERHYLPLELQPLEDEDKKTYIARVFGLKGAIPADFFVMGPDDYKALKKKIKAHQGTQQSAEEFKVRDESDIPSHGEFWELSSPDPMGEDTELDPLSIEEIESRARRLNNPYKPQNASMLRRLARAWDRKDAEERRRNCDPADDLCGLLAPTSIFGDRLIVAQDADRFPGPPAPVRDLFESETIKPPPKSGKKETEEFVEPPASAEGVVLPAQDIPELSPSFPPPAPEELPEVFDENEDAYKAATNFDKSEGNVEPIPEKTLEEMSDAELAMEYKRAQLLAKEGDTRLLDAVEDEIIRRISEEHPKFGTAIPRGLTPGQPANADLPADIMIKMLENIAEGKNPYGPGKGGVAWFVSEGNPYIGKSTETRYSFPVELTDAAGRMIITSADLEKIFSELEPEAKVKVEAEFRAKAGLPESSPLSNTAKKKIGKQLRGATERLMWERVGEMVAASETGVGEVVLENSRFSQLPRREGGAFRNGRFVLVRDMKHIRVKGGATQILDTLKTAGVKPDPTLTAAGEALAKRQKWAGRVRGAFRYGGKVLLVVAAVNDTYRIIVAEDHLKETVNVAGGWAGALAAGAIFAEVWTPADAAGPVAWAIHGVGTLVAGGIGYYVGSETTAWVYELTVEDDSGVEKLK